MNTILSIKGMTCASCSNRIEKKLSKLENILDVNVNLSTEKTSVSSEEELDFNEINSVIEKLGFEVEKEKIEIDIEGMTCSSCSSRIEKQIAKMQGILESNVNLSTNKGTFIVLKNVQNEKSIIQKIEKLGYSGKKTESLALKDTHNTLKKKRNILVLSLILSFPLLLSMFDMMFDLTLIPDIFSNGYFQLSLATIVQFYCGWQFYKSSWANISHFSANMDVLVAMGTSAAYFFSIYNIFYNEHLYFETSAVLITLILFGKYLEERAKGKTTEAISKLLNLSPKEAIVLRDDKEIIVTTDNVIKDDILLVKAGAKIPVDGIVIDGMSYVDESMITGESKAVKKSIDSSVVGGTINGNGTFRYKATKLGDESFLSQIIKVVEEAQGSKASIQRFADVISGYFVPAVLFLRYLLFPIGILSHQISTYLL
jgi:P-type Cu+ transporter